jgi:large subunit ribosomal protein L29
MKIKDIRERTDEELTGLLQELREEKFKLAIASRTGQLENSARIRTVRRDIAKVLTEVNARAAVAS